MAIGVIGLLVVGVVVVVVLGVALVIVMRRSSDVPARVDLPISPPSSDVPPDLVEQAQSMLAQGKKIQAIKQVREATGMGLAEAKRYVEGLPPGSSVFQDLPVHQAQTFDGDLEQEARRALVEGGKIQAIKRVRELTGQGLKEAKDFVDGLQMRP